MLNPLPPFIKFENRTFKINPTFPKDVGVYFIKVEITDGYSFPNKYQLKIKVENPPIKRLETKASFNMTKAGVRITKVSRDAKITLKILSK